MPRGYKMEDLHRWKIHYRLISFAIVKPDDTKPTIAVSSCLLGNNVRYDGEHKQNLAVVSLCKEFECIPICPEVAVGLGVPRPPVQLVMRKDIEAIGLSDPSLNISHKLKNFADEKVNDLSSICGYVFKARSPSCGVNSTPVYDVNGNELGKTSGIFAAEIQVRFPELPVIEETDISSAQECRHFVRQVWKYYNAGGTLRK